MEDDPQRELMAGNRVGRFVSWLLTKYDVPPGGMRTLRLRLPEEARAYLAEHPEDGRAESLVAHVRTDPRFTTLEVRQGQRTQLVQLQDLRPVTPLEGDSPMDALVAQIRRMAFDEAGRDFLDLRERVTRARELLKEADDLLRDRNT